MTTSVKDSRQEFEAWVTSLGFVVSVQDGSYWAPSVEAMWRGWIASSSRANKSIDGLEELLNEVSEMLSNDPSCAERMQGFRFAMPDELRGFALMLTEPPEGYKAALRSQGKVVSVEKLNALVDRMDKVDQMLTEGEIYSSIAVEDIVYAYQLDLTAIIGEGD